MGLLFLPFAAVSLLELVLLIRIGGMIGPAATVLICIMTGFVGVSIARVQGFGVWMRMRESMQRQIMPTEELLDGIMLFAAAICLMAPGFMTDIFGIALLLPSIRKKIKAKIVARMQTSSPHEYSTSVHESEIYEVHVDEWKRDEQEAKRPKIIDMN